MSYFTQATFTFLKDLTENNTREWFQENKHRYEDDVRDPAIRFITDFGGHLKALSEHFRSDPRTVGGSMFRIYRDTRFSKDKTPYKTAIGIQFRHELGKDAHAPGFYLHLEPRQVFAGTGLWRPDSATTKKIRDAIVAKPAAWKRARSGRALLALCTFEGDSLKRPPRGYDADHPLIEDIKRKDFLALAPFSQAEVCAGDFLLRFARFCRTVAPYTAFLTDAVGLEW